MVIGHVLALRGFNRKQIVTLFLPALAILVLLINMYGCVTVLREFKNMWDDKKTLPGESRQVCALTHF